MPGLPDQLVVHGCGSGHVGVVEHLATVEHLAFGLEDGINENFAKEVNAMLNRKGNIVK